VKYYVREVNGWGFMETEVNSLASARRLAADLRRDGAARVRVGTVVTRKEREATAALLNTLADYIFPGKNYASSARLIRLEGAWAAFLAAKGASK